MTVYQSTPRVIPQNQQNELSTPILDSSGRAHLYWSALPEEVLQRILGFVYNPASFDFNGLRARLVSKRFRLSSDAFFCHQAPQYLTLLEAKNELEKLFLIAFRNFDPAHFHLSKKADQGLKALQVACGLPFSKFVKSFKPSKNDSEKEDLRDRAIVNTLFKISSFNLRTGLEVAITSRDSLLAKKILEQPSLSLMRDASVDEAKTTELNAAVANTVDKNEKNRFRLALERHLYEIRKHPYYLLEDAVENGTDDILKLLLDYLSKKLGGVRIYNYSLKKAVQKENDDILKSLLDYLTEKLGNARLGDRHLVPYAIQNRKQAIANVLLNPKYNLKIKLHHAFDLDCLELLIEPILTVDIHILADLYQVLEIALENDWQNEDEDEDFYETARKQMIQLFKDPRLDLKANDYALFKTITEISPGLANLLQAPLEIDYYKKLFEPVFFKGESRAFMMHALFNRALELAACTPGEPFDAFNIKKIYQQFCETPKDRQARREARIANTNRVDRANKIFELPSLSLITNFSEGSAQSALTSAIASTDDPKEKGDLRSALAQQREKQNPPDNFLLKKAVINGTDNILKSLLDSLTEKLGNARLSDKYLFPLALQMRHQATVSVLLNPKYNLKIELRHAFDLDCLEVLIEPILTIDIHILVDLYQVLELALEDDSTSEDNEDFYETAREQMIRLFQDPRLDLKANDYALFKTITEISPGLANFLQDQFEIDYYKKLFTPIFKGKNRTFITHALFNYALELAACAPEKRFDVFDIKKVYRKFCVAPKDRHTRREALLAKLDLAGNDHKRRKISEDSNSRFLNLKNRLKVLADDFEKLPATNSKRASIILESRQFLSYLDCLVSDF